MAKFAQYTSSRLNAANVFVPFLSSIEACAGIRGQSDSNWNEIANALRENLDEELGIIDGKCVPKAAHEEWRKKYRCGIERVLQSRGISLSDQDVSESGDFNSVVRAWTKFPLQNYASLPFRIGGFTALEGMLEEEFDAQKTYIDQFPDLTSNERIYITHHAGHEKEHLADIARPLLQLCQRSPHNCEDVISGIEAMFRERYKFLSVHMREKSWIQRIFQ